MKRLALQEVWIIGAGKFGLRAARILEAKEARAVLVDIRAEALSRWWDSGSTVVREGVSFLVENLEAGRLPDWIIPCLPVHLVFQWVCRSLAGSHRLTPFPVPEEVAGLLPHPLQGKSGELYISHADFICPENCPEPPRRCTVTGKPRKKDMFRILEDLDRPDFRSLVVRSHQLAPGVGGYPPESLFRAREELAACRGPVLVSTACRCQGVMNAILVEERSGT